MSMRADERISFTLTELQRNAIQNPPTQTRRREGGITAAAAAVAGAVDLEDRNASTKVDMQRAPPPRLKQRNCCSTLAGIWFAFSIVAGLLILANTFLTLHAGTSDDAPSTRRLARDPGITDTCAFGVWDSRRKLTSLQLQVGVSMALGVRADDGDIQISALDNFFFDVAVQHCTAEEVDYLASGAFLDRLNEQLDHYDGYTVLSKPPVLLKSK